MVSWHFRLHHEWGQTRDVGEENWKIQGNGEVGFVGTTC